jgi:uncharacterized protein (TIGR01244 family)
VIAASVLLGAEGFQGQFAMKITPLTPEFSVSPQIRPEDVAEIAAAGYRSILCNRPDGEDAGQPDYATIKAAAEAAGLEVLHVPVISGAITQGNVEDFRAAVADLPTPLLAYCRSGTRCANLWDMTR